MVHRFALVTLLGVVMLLVVSVQAQINSPLEKLASVNLRSDLAKTRSDQDKLDVIIDLKEQVDVMNLKSNIESRIASTLGKVSTSFISDLVARSVVHELRLNADLTQRNMLAHLKENEEYEVKSLWIVNAIVINKASVSLLNDLAVRFQNEIKRIQVNARVTTPVLNQRPVTSNGIRLGNEMIEINLKYIQATDMWQLGYQGEGITLSMVDTGVDAVGHPALRDKYRGKSGDHDYNWWDPYHQSQQPHDSDHHGTHCTGTMVGSDDTDGIHHIYGVAPKANFIACMGLDRGSGTIDALLSCWQFTMAPTDLNGNNPDTSRRAHVTSNSWGATGYSSTFDVFKTAADSLRASGIFVALAAGNTGAGCQTMNSPGVFDNVFAICAIDKHYGNITNFSSRGPPPSSLGTYTKPDICAPGKDIISSVPGRRYASFSGTSMATPHVAAAVALLWEAVPGIARNVDATEELFKLTAENKGAAQCNSLQQIPNNVYGHGNIQILEAFKAAQGKH